LTAEYPIRLGAPDDFARVRAYLSGLGLDRDSIYGTLPFKEDGTIDAQKWTETKRTIAPALSLAIDVFVRGDSVSEPDFRAACGADTYRSLCALGLLRPSKPDASRLVSPVWLYQVDGFFVISDRFEDADGNAFAPPDDVVFPAFNHLTMRFLRILPDARRGEALDLCGGCGIGALHLARTARSAASADVTPRAAFFTAFNARLNGVAIESLCGDLYDPAGERTFDLITAHPPFIAAIGAQRMIFRDADEFGEGIARRIVAGLPARLRAGGTAIIVFAGWDTVTPLERRAQEWLGDAAASFDVALAEFTRTPIESVIGDIRKLQKDANENNIAAFENNLHAWGAQRRIYGALAFRRSGTSAREPLRLRLSDEASGVALQRALDWRAARRRSDFAENIAAAKPRASAHLEMNVRHVSRDGRLAVSDVMFEMAEGILGKLKPDPWIVPWLMRLDGTQSVADVYAAAHATGALPADFKLADFAGLVALMLERGFLDAEAPSSGN
jgi:hypothetical protein